MNKVSFSNDNINGQISLCNDTIYIKLKENGLNYDVYDGNYTKEHIDIPAKFNINEIYEIIKKCVSVNNDEYHEFFNYEIIPLNNSIKLCFNVLICENVNIDFNIDVIKKEISEKEKLFSEFMNEIKTEIVELKKSNDELTEKHKENKKMLKLQDDFIKNILCNGLVKFHEHDNKYSFNDTYIMCHNTSYPYNFALLYAFTKLETLEISGNVICKCCSRHASCRDARNDTVTKIITRDITASLGMFNINKFPNLTDIEFINCQTIISTTIINELKSSTHNIKHIKIKQSRPGFDMVELQTYCSPVNITITTT